MRLGPSVVSAIALTFLLLVAVARLSVQPAVSAAHPAQPLASGPEAEAITTASGTGAPPPVSATTTAFPTVADPAATHEAPLPSAVLAGVALLSITAAHSFGRKRRRAQRA